VQSERSVLSGRVGPFEILPFDAALGAEIRGLDLRRLDDEGFRILRQAYLDHLVVLVRDQQLPDPQLVEIARRFGPIEMPPSPGERSAHHHFDGPPEITVVSNVKVGGTPIGELGDGEVIWHSDYSFREVTAGMRLLYALEVPPAGAGASTEFCNTYAAYDTLPPALKTRVHGTTIKHDTAYDTNRNLRRGAREVTDLRLGHGPDHPVVYTHPETGCNALFLGRRLKHYVNGLEPGESEAMLDELWAHTVQPGHCVAHEWRAGDLVLWDNRCTLHRRGAFDSRSRRTMHAAQTGGQKPAEAPDARSRPPHPRAGLHASRPR
jgi:taurine dioxygenase